MRLAVQLALPLAALAQLQPFTLTQTEGPAGGPTRAIITTHTADGARFVLHLPQPLEPGSPSPRTVTLPNEGKRFLITHELKLISTYYLTPRDIAALKNPKYSPVCAEHAGSGATLTDQTHLFGVLAFRYDSLLRGGAEKHSQWYAPALNCFPLQYEVHTFESGGWKLTFSRVPTLLQLDPPSDVDLFVPSSYREAPPSEHQKAAIARKRGTPFGSHSNDAALENTFQRIDRHYHESRQTKPPQ